MHHLEIVVLMLGAALMGVMVGDAMHKHFIFDPIVAGLRADVDAAKRRPCPVCPKPVVHHHRPIVHHHHVQSAQWPFSN